MNVHEGRVWTFGDDVDTDLIVPGRFLILEPSEIAQHVMAGIRPGFAELVEEGDIVVAGENFGSGSSREVAPRALREVGIVAVVAKSLPVVLVSATVPSGWPLILARAAAMAAASAAFCARRCS